MVGGLIIVLIEIHWITFRISPVERPDNALSLPTINWGINWITGKSSAPTPVVLFMTTVGRSVNLDAQEAGEVTAIIDPLGVNCGW